MLGTYPAKILLFGEYTILNGSKALAIPYPVLQGRWSLDSCDSENALRSRKELFSFLENSESRYFNFEQLKSELNKGLWFDSNIPQGFGLGSSGALIAALYDRFGQKQDDILDKKTILASLENYFHGSSSGIDPLVSLLNKPLLIHSFEKIEPLESLINLDHFFLINSGQQRNTGPLVNIYQEKMKDPEFKNSCANILSREVNFAIEDVLSGADTKNLFHHMWLISKFQWEYFQEMIPIQFKQIWEKGLDSGEYVLKLCGAGGGGFILGFSYNRYDSHLLPSIEKFELRNIL